MGNVAIQVPHVKSDNVKLTNSETRNIAVHKQELSDRRVTITLVAVVGKVTFTKYYTSFLM